MCVYRKRKSETTSSTIIEEEITRTTTKRSRGNGEPVTTSTRSVSRHVLPSSGVLPAGITKSAANAAKLIGNVHDGFFNEVHTPYTIP